MRRLRNSAGGASGLLKVIEIWRAGYRKYG
jgi:hypothetical protein